MRERESVRAECSWVFYTLRVLFLTHNNHIKTTRKRKEREAMKETKKQANEEEEQTDREMGPAAVADPRDTASADTRTRRIPHTTTATTTTSDR